MLARNLRHVLQSRCFHATPVNSTFWVKSKKQGELIVQILKIAG